MYLLEAKKRAEKEYKKQQEKERKEAKERARQEGKALAKAQRDKAKQEKEASRRPTAKPQQKGSNAAMEAQRALEEAQMQEAMRRSNAEAEAKARAKERQRQDEIRQTRKALESDYDYEDSSQFNVKIGQQASPKADMQFQVVQGTPDNKAMRRRSIGGETWNDMSINCYYVGTFEVGKGTQINKQEVKNGINVMKDYIQNQREATLIVCLEGLKVVDTTSSKVAMAHALSRVSMAAADPTLPLFGFVAKNPGVPDKYCHVFNMSSRANAEYLQGLVMKAFRLAFANDRSTGRPQQQPPMANSNRQWAKHNPLPGQGRAIPNRAPSSAGHAGPARTRQSSAGPSSRAPPPSGLSAVQAAHAAAGGRTVAPQQSQRGPSKDSRNSDGYALPQDAKLVASAPKASAPQKDPVHAVSTGMSGLSIEDAAWFQAGVPREIAMELLEMSDDGAFVVRDSSSQPGNYALTMKGDSLMHHFIIRKVPQGYVLGSPDQGQSPFPDLGTLIVNYSATPGCLPCCLTLDSFNKAYVEADHEQEESNASFIDPDYQDLKTLMEIGPK